ncbi:TetR family transcriptional regulator [Ketogulonicigenium vulgare]|nr:TetR family transcriptional regulator [Ketogulonicigenium vulgare]
MLNAALALIEEKGPTGFTLSEAARQAGVTPAAIYRHFAGRDDLLIAAAIQGHQILAQNMAAIIVEDAAPDVILRAAGRVFLDFARSHPGHYIAMFESGLHPGVNADLDSAGAGTQAVMTRATQRLLEGSDIDGKMVTAHMLALCHGMVELFARGPKGAANTEKMLDSALQIYLRGIRA